MPDTTPDQVPGDLYDTACKAAFAQIRDSIGAGRLYLPDAIQAALAAVLPELRERIAGEVEAHAESIGWYEGGGVWAEALDVIRQEPWTLVEPATADGEAAQEVGRG
ncbi:MAG TPA: hypothetical protein VGD91_24945 [Trebonia sp.]